MIMLKTAVMYRQYLKIEGDKNEFGFKHWNRSKRFN